jgi:hypothetical protein
MQRGDRRCDLKIPRPAVRNRSMAHRFATVAEPGTKRVLAAVLSAAAARSRKRHVKHSLTGVFQPATCRR